MLQWNEKLYIGADVKNPEEVKDKLNQNKWMPGIFLLTFSSNPDNLLEIIPAIVLKQEAARSLCQEIIGIARGKEEAINLAASVIEEVYQKTGTFQVQNYIKNR